MGEDKHLNYNLIHTSGKDNITLYMRNVFGLNFVVQTNMGRDFGVHSPPCSIFQTSGTG